MPCQTKKGARTLLGGMEGKEGGQLSGQRTVPKGKQDESYEVVRERLSLPSVCSYICLSFCESECRRDEGNEPVGIRALKKIVSEHPTDLWKKNLKAPSSTGKKVAILGSGPAGLKAGYYLGEKRP